MASTTLDAFVVDEQVELDGRPAASTSSLRPLRPSSSARAGPSEGAIVYLDEYDRPVSAGPDGGRPLMAGRSVGQGGGGEHVGADDPVGESSLMARLGSRGAGAMTGAIATSLLMTPFDVLKTRLQSRPPPSTPPKPQPSASPLALSPAAHPPCCTTTLLNRPTAPSLSSSLPGAATHRAHQLYCSSSSSDVARLLRSSSSSATAALRLDHVPVGCESPAGWRRLIDDFRLGKVIVGTLGAGKGKGPALGGFWQEVRNVRNESGIRGLWKGVGTTLSMGVPSSALYMLGYTHLNLHILSFAPNSATLSVLSPLFAGALSRTCSVTLLSPLELFRTRLQAMPAPNLPPPSVKSTLAGLSAMVRKRGVRTLWRGLGATLWRDVPFSAIYWAGYEIMKLRVLTGPTWVKNRPGGKGEWARAMVAGASSGMVAAFLTTPFDVLKTRRQVFIQKAPTSTPTSSISAVPSSKPTGTSSSQPKITTRPRPNVPGTFPLLLGIIKAEGPQALFAGLAPRLLKVAPACAIMISCYEGVGSWLEGQGRALREE